MRNKQCIVQTCLNSSVKNESSNIPNETLFHNFPTNDKLRSKWLKHLPNPEIYQGLPFSVLKNMTICHLHFETDQYQNKERKRLLRGAVPTIFLGNISSAKDDSIILDNCSYELVNNNFEKVTQNEEARQKETVINNRPVTVQNPTEENPREESKLLDYCDADLETSKTLLTDYVNGRWTTLMKSVYESELEKSVKKGLRRKQENKCNNNNIVNDVLSKLDGIIITKTKDNPELENQKVKTKSCIYRCNFCSLQFNDLKPLYHHKLFNHDQDEYRHRILNRMKSQKEHTSNIENAENIENIPPVEKLTKEKVERASFTCEKCEKIFKNRSKFIEHKNCHEGIKNFYCEKCGKGFFSTRQLKEHLKSHSEIKNFECEICNKTFKGKRNLYIHKQIHQQEQFICHICGVSRKHSISLKLHMVCHSNEWKFSCRFCSHRFKRKTDLHNHLRIHTNERPYKCTKCNESYRSSYSLKLHLVKFHLKVRNFKCDICHKQFYAKKNLDQHCKTHTSNPVFCTLCAKPFTSLSNLQRHIRIVHNEVKNFECKICKKPFGEEHNLRAHVGIHSDEKFKCPKCPKYFNAKKYLNQHCKTHTSDRVLCTSCGKVFTSLSNLQRHVKIVHNNIKNFECEICKKRFGERAYLRAHMGVHSNERFKCPKCSIFFKLPSYLKVHMKRKHSGTKVYECIDCKGSFESIEDIQTHDCGILLQHDSTNSSNLYFYIEPSSTSIFPLH